MREETEDQEEEEDKEEDKEEDEEEDEEEDKEEDEEEDEIEEEEEDEEGELKMPELQRLIICLQQSLQYAIMMIVKTCLVTRTSPSKSLIKNCDRMAESFKVKVFFSKNDIAKIDQRYFYLDHRP